MNETVNEVQRIASELSSVNPETKEKALQWIRQGGLKKLEPGIEEYLQLFTFLPTAIPIHPTRWYRIRSVYDRYRQDFDQMRGASEGTSKYTQKKMQTHVYRDVVERIRWADYILRRAGYNPTAGEYMKIINDVYLPYGSEVTLPESEMNTQNVEPIIRLLCKFDFDRLLRFLGSAVAAILTRSGAYFGAASSIDQMLVQKYLSGQRPFSFERKELPLDRYDIFNTWYEKNVLSPPLPPKPSTPDIKVIEDLARQYNQGPAFNPVWGEREKFLQSHPNLVLLWSDGDITRVPYFNVHGYGSEWVIDRYKNGAWQLNLRFCCFTFPEVPPANAYLPDLTYASMTPEQALAIRDRMLAYEAQE